MPDSLNILNGIFGFMLGVLATDWSYERNRRKAEKLRSRSGSSGPKAAGTEVVSMLPELADDAILVDVVTDSLNVDKYISAVADSGAGAITTFLGVTRDNFQGKMVYKLEYEAYEPMARRMLQKICQEVGRKWAVKRIALAHKIGSCGVGETSVIIAVSSAHRKDSLEACHWVIDELKARVPIWKKEFFEDGEVWKENVEAKHLVESYVMA